MPDTYDLNSPFDLVDAIKYTILSDPKTVQ